MFPTVSFGQSTLEMTVDSIEHELTKDLKDEARVDYLTNLASILLRVDTVKSKNYAIEALELSQKIDYQKGEILSLNWFARYYTEIGRLDTALLILDQITSNKEAENQHAVAQAYVSMGNILDINGSYAEALEAYFMSDSIFSQLGDLGGMGSATMGIGNIYQLNNRHEEAIVYFRKSANCLMAAKSPYASWSLNNMAEAMESLEMYDSAAFYFNKSLLMKEEVGDFYGASYTYTNLGNLAERREEYGKAEFYYQKALDILK